MFQKLKERWKVNGLNLALIITTFALGGSLCAYAGRKLLIWMQIDKASVGGLILYILLITLLWPLAVLLVSYPLGQFAFFKKYLARVFKKLSGGKSKADEADKINTTRIAIFASGAGSNAQQIINYFKGADLIRIQLIVCNKPTAGVLSIAERENIPSLLIEKERFFNGDHYLPELQKNNIDLIVLAGFLWKVPEALIKAYPKKIVNIHPALLPKYGGKGMYGAHVHKSVIENKESESGITIHYVDELYDHGAVIFQASCPVTQIDTADSLAEKIHILEHEYYPKAIAQLINRY